MAHALPLVCSHNSCCFHTSSLRFDHLEKCQVLSHLSSFLELCCPLFLEHGSPSNIKVWLIYRESPPENDTSTEGSEQSQEARGGDSCWGQTPRPAAAWEWRPLPASPTDVSVPGTRPATWVLAFSETTLVPVGIPPYKVHVLLSLHTSQTIGCTAPVLCRGRKTEYPIHFLEHQVYYKILTNQIL